METGKPLIINPNTQESKRHQKNKYEHLGLAYLAAHLEHKGILVDILDSRAEELSMKESIEYLKQKTRSLVGFSIFSADALEWVSEFSKQVKEISPTTLTVVGGYYPSLETKKTLSEATNIDIAILGEAELTLEEVINVTNLNGDYTNIRGIAYRKNTQIIKTSPRSLIQNLDDLAFPKRYLTGNQEWFMEGSRGCFGKCTFCAVNPSFSDNQSIWRHRSAKNIIEEMKSLLQHNPSMNKFRFIDCDFLGSQSMKERNLEFADLVSKQLPTVDLVIETSVRNISEKNRELIQSLKHAGLSEVYVGIESGSNEILKKMQKGNNAHKAIEAIRVLEDVGVFYKIGFMMFTPWSTADSIRENLEFLKNLSFLDLHYLFGTMDVIPGTPAMNCSGEIFYNETKNHGYYSYRNIPPVENLKMFCSYFSQNYSEFMEEIFDIYENNRFKYRSGNTDIIYKARELSSIVIEIFKYFFENVCDEKNFNSLAESCLKRYGPKIKKLKE